MQMTPTIRYNAVLVVALCVAILAAFSSPPGADGAATDGPVLLSGTMADLWTAIAASGKVETQPAGDGDATWLPVRRGDQVAALSRIQTGGGGRATLSCGADVILVDPDSELVLPASGTATGDVRIEQHSGSALYDLETRPSRRLEVVTPDLVAGVKGTVFSVVVGDDFVAVNVAEGNVEIRTPSGGHASLFAGDLGLLERRDGMLEVFRDGMIDRWPGAADDFARLSRRRLRQMVAKASWDRGVPDGRFGGPDHSKGKTDQKDGKDAKNKNSRGKDDRGGRLGDDRDDHRKDHDRRKDKPRTDKPKGDHD